MPTTSLARRFPSAYTLFNRLLNLPASIAETFGVKSRKQRHATRLHIESLEDRVVPTSMSLLYNFSDDGGTVSSGLNRTLTVGQPLVVEAEVARTTNGTTASPASPTPTGTLTFTLTYSGFTNYTIGTATLSSAGGNIAEAELVTTDLPSTPDSYTLNISYSGDTNYSSTSASSIGTITVQAPASNTPTDLAPIGGLGALPVPSGDGIAASAAMSPTGVMYGTGELVASRSDLTSNGFGTPWGEGWSWSSMGGDYADGLSGGNQTQAPHLVNINSQTTIAVVNGASADFFDLYGGTFNPRFGLDATLTHNTGNGTYVLTLAGNTYTFNDFSGYNTTALAGSLLSVSDAYGDVTSVQTWNAAGAPTQVERTYGSGSTEVYEAFNSTYLTSGANTGLLSTVTQQTKVGSGSWTTIATTTYTYYGSGSLYGSVGELDTAVTVDASSNILSAAYYRYSASEFSYAINTAGYEQLIATYGTNLDSISNVAPYAYLSVSGTSQTSIVEVPASASVPLQEYNYSYTTNNGLGVNLQQDPNQWHTKTEEDLPDGNKNFVYTNAFGQPVFTIYEDVASGDKWETDYRYDSTGRLIEESAPSAVTGYSESYNDLVNWSGNSATDISSSSGLITTYTYGSSTTATSTTAGNVAGYIEQTAIQQGTGGTSIPQETYAYLSNAGGGVTVYKVASDTVYSGTGGSGAETTSYAYSYYSGTNAVYSITATLPTITTAQNGSNSANTTETVYDQFGNPVWTMDPNGYVTYTQFDTLTGAVVKQIADVKTSDAGNGDFTGLPSGWTTASTSMELITSDQVDDLGRVTKRTNPNGSVDYFVYIDSANEVREYDGWNSTTNTATGPTKVTIDDLVDGYLESLTMTAAPSVSGGVPTGTESIADVQSLSRSLMTPQGVKYEEDDYFNLGGLTYTSGSMGTAGTNYYKTQYGYDADGNQNVTISPQGTIYITVYDGQHRKVSEWVGTDDTPSSGTWSPTNNSSPCNMVETESFVYDGGGVGDGNLTQMTQYPGGGATNRVDDYWYDWRDRQVAEKDGVETTETDGVNRPLTVLTYDNLNEVTEEQVYDGDGVTPSISSGVISLPGGTSSDLRAETITSFDNQGNVYETQVYDVNPTSGSVSTYALTTNNYYDADGHLIAESAPGGLWTKMTYDGDGRESMIYQTDGHSGTSYSDAASVSSDTVLSQTQTLYDKDGMVAETITSDRFDNDSSTSYGALGSPSSGIGARVYYEGYYYDLADRPIASVNVGTDGGSAWSMPGSTPSRSSTVLVTSESYAADAVQTVKLTGSPTGGTFTLTFGGYTTSSIAYNASASTVQSDLTAITSIGSSNVVVTQAVNGGWEVRFTGSLAGVYQTQMTATGSLTGGTSPGVAISTLSLGGDAGHSVDVTDPDDIDSRTYSDPLGRAVQTIQDFTTGAVSASSNKTTDFTYNAVGQTSLTAELTSGAGETTSWTYGVTTSGGSELDSNDIESVSEQPNPSTGAPDASLGTTITVNALGQTLTSTDPNGNTHTYTYDVLGRETSDAVTTLGSGVDGSIRRIATAYDSQGNPYLVTSYNAASGGSVVNQVEDVYNGLDQLTGEYQAVGGSVNTSTSPDVQYAYTEMASGANNSRPTTMTYPDGYVVDYNYSSGLNSNISRLSSLSDSTGTLESYKFMGLDIIVEMDHPESGINLTYITQTSGTGDAGDQYTGLDRFGRVVEQNWYDPTTSSSVVDLKYGYDDDGNVLYRNDLVNTASGELYGYDSLGQITSFGRGTLTSGNTALSSPSVSETWSYDPLGNHLADSTGLTSTFNYDNQITSVSSGTTPTYDADGNMTTDQNGLQYIYNAWGELVKVENSGDTVLETFSYNGLSDRMTNTVSGTTTNFFYSTSGQVLEEQANATGYYTQRYVWSPAYVNEMVDRDNDTSGTGLTATGSSYTRLFALIDANSNVVALVNASGSVVERYIYDPFGSSTVLNASYGVESGSSYNWVYGFQEGRLDTITGDTHFGARNLDPGIGTWTSEDPLGWV